MTNIQYDRSSISFVDLDGNHPKEISDLNWHLKYIRSSLDRSMKNGRYSHGFAIEICLNWHSRRIEPDFIFEEIKKLEGLDTNPSRMKKEKILRSPLKGFWHKHYYQPLGIFQNLLDELEKMEKDGSLLAAFKPFMGKMADDHMEEIVDILSERPLRRRSERSKMTGEFFIFEKMPDGTNYYITLGFHRDWEKLRAAVDGYKILDDPSLINKPTI
jgi:hypothetical protein